MDNKYSFNLNNLVNNSNGNSCVVNKIETLKHKINNNKFSIDAEKFYKNNQTLMIELSEENIVTIADLDNYIDWIKNDKQWC